MSLREGLSNSWKNSPDLSGSELPVLYLNLLFKYEILV